MNQSKLKRWTLGLLCLVLYSTSMYAQERIHVKGVVTDSAGMALPGASVSQIGREKKNVAADAEGRFELDVEAASRLRISMTGYEQLIVTVNSPTLKVVLRQSATSLKDFVVTGYGTQRKDLVTGSVATMKMDEDRRNFPTTSVANLMAGQMPGVFVSTPSGIPGSAPTVRIRVGSSFVNQEVLYVIDGIIASADEFNTLAPNDIDNISVLKDAAAAAVYGARAAGGVVLITTRRGALGLARINYSFNTGFSKRGKNAERTSAIETGEIFNRLNPGSSTLWSQSDFDYFRKINNGWGYDQLNEVYNDPNISSHNLSASGGSEKVKYFVSGAYVKEDAVMKNLTFDRYNFRANLTADLTPRIQLFAGVSLANSLTYGPPNTAVAANPNDLYRKQLLWQPEQPVWTDNGNPIDYGWIANVGAEARGDGGYIKGNRLMPNINLRLQYRVAGIPGLTAVGQFSKYYSYNRGKAFEKQYDMWVMKTTGVRQISTNDADRVAIKRSSQIGKSYLQENYNWMSSYTLNFQLRYDTVFKKVHHVSAMMLFEKSHSEVGGVSTGRDNFPVYLTDQWWATSGDRIDSYNGGNSEQATGRRSWVGQLGYDYDGRYIAAFSYRYDGSMLFGPSQRWGFFPSASAGWIVSKEKFFANVKSIQFLKLRGSVGLTGYDFVGGWQWEKTYLTGSSAYFGTDPKTNSGVTYGPIVNPNLTWEKTLNYNAAVEANFLDYYTATLELYKVRTYDILGPRIASVPPTFSRTLPSSNYGEMDAKGIEFSVGMNRAAGNFKYYVNANMGYGAAKFVIRDENITYPWQKSVGFNNRRVVSRVATGMLRTQADVDAFVAKNPNYKYYGISPQPGQLTYKDISGPNNQPDGLIDDWDQEVLKPNNNPITVGLNLGGEWKGFALQASFSGNFRQYRMVNSLVEGNVEWNRMWRKWYTDGWTPENTGAELPRRYSANDGANRVTNDASSFWMKESSFLRLRFLAASYSVPYSLTNKAGISGLKFFFNGSNLFVISKFGKQYFDPEMNDGFTYPIMKAFNFGAILSL